ncbi:MAG: hypothetical protein ACUVWO_16935 [Thermodesulfobacteriota bacterium]
MSNWLEPLIQELTEKALPAYSPLAEEEQSISPAFAEEASVEVVEGPEDSFAPVEVEKAEEIRFEAFLDGVQRTVLWYRMPLPTGALVPIHIAHIAAGVILRDDDGRLYMKPDLVAARLLLLGPFAGMKQAGVTLPSIENFPSEAMWDTDNRTFTFPQTLNEWCLCDTTFRSTEQDREKQTEGALIENALFNEGMVRSRAQGRVATLRQRLEFAVLARFRNRYPKKWVLIDGPLFFIDKWRRRAANILGADLKETDEGVFEDKLLYRAVGLIKSQRLRPKRPDQVIKIGPTQRSLVARLSQEVDIKDRRESPDEEGPYGGGHLTWYTRLRSRSQPPYGLLGLIRLDVHRSTLELARIDHLNPLNFGDLRPVIDAITQATWRERWPAFRRVDDYRSAGEPYPVQQVERALKAMTLPRRFLAHLCVHTATR